MILFIKKAVPRFASKRKTCKPFRSTGTV
jgi:hypothetical protein